jgi:hypothetical protein
VTARDLAAVSPRRRQDIVGALRRGTVPSQGLDVLAVGLDRFVGAVDDELDRVAGGGGVFKAVRGEYGAGKTFFARWLVERAKRVGMAGAEVQISETETPLHRLETVYRRVTESLTTAELPPSAFRPVLDAWLYTVEEDALAHGAAAGTDHRAADGRALADAVDALLERRLADVSRSAPTFAVALRGYRRAQAAGEVEIADGIAAWLGGQPHVSAAARRYAGVRGELDHFGALGFLQGLLAVLRDAGHPGLVFVLDEVETLQRVRGDVRDKALNALRQLVDEVDAGRFPGLYLVITGTPAFFDGPSGAGRLAPLAQRLATDFSAESRFDNPRAVQIRLPGFGHDTLIELGAVVRNLYAMGSAAPVRVRGLVDDAYLADLALGVAGGLGGQVGVAPRLYLKKLVGDVLDRVDQFPGFDPRRHYRLTLTATDLTPQEQAAAGLPLGRPPAAASVDEVDIDPL